MRKPLLFLFSIIFILFATKTFAVEVSQPTLINSGKNSIFKVKVLGLKSGQTAILNIGADFLLDQKKPVLIARKTIKITDLDVNGFYTYVDSKNYPLNIFKPVFNIQYSTNQNNSSNIGLTAIQSSADCFSGACFRITEMNYKSLKYSISLEKDNNIVKIGIECYAKGSDALEGGEITIDYTEAKKEIIEFTKKYDDKIYTCKPFVVTTGFLGVKKTNYGKEITYPFFPIVKISSLSYSPIIKVSADIDSGEQDYYPSFVIKDKESNNLYCFVSKKQNSSISSVTANFDPRLPINGFECKYWFPMLDVSRKLRMKTGSEYSIGVVAKGVENKFTSTINFVDFTYKQNVSYPYQVNTVSADKDTKNLKIFLSATIPTGQNFDKAWFYTRMEGSKDKYKLLGNVKEIVLNEKENKFSLITTYPKVSIYNEKLGENIQMPYQDGKKYVFGFCNINKGEAVCKETPAYLIVNASKYATYCSNNMGKDGVLSIQKAKNIITMVSADTGVSSYLLMAIIMQETHLGKGAEGVGQCYFPSGTEEEMKKQGKTNCVPRIFENDPNPDKDFDIFKRVCSNIGWDWRKVVVSCKQDSGSHGCAMGFTQIMQVEWENVEDKIMQKTKRSIANPWNHCDAILGSAFKLKSDGATTLGFKAAILGYNNANWYLNQVTAKIDCIKAYWSNNDILESKCLTAGE